MFTIEMDWDETAITILDQSDNYEDVQFVVFDDIVYIRQWDDDLDQFNLRIFAGTCLWRIPSSEEMEIRAELRGGLIAYGNHIDPEENND